MRGKNRVVILLFISMVIFMTNIFAEYNKKNNVIEALNIDNKKTVNVVAVGNILVHYDQIISAYNNKSYDYEFDENFKYIKKYIEEADLAYCTIEGAFGGKELGYSGYPRFNTPEAMLNALKNTGFDIINAANDNILDSLNVGYFNTIENLKKSNLKYTGIRQKKDDKTYVIEKIKGIKIGFTSYTFSDCFEGNDEDVLELINSYSYDDLDNDLLKIEKEIEDMKNDGAKFIVVGMHWGDEYSTEINEKQKYIAQKLNSYAVDVILGSHPNVIEPIETIINNENGNSTLVVYSMGNFISNQRKETMGNKLCEDSIILNLELQKKFNGDVNLVSFNYIPTWTLKYKTEDGDSKYYILDSNSVLGYENKEEIPQSILDSLEDSVQSIKSILND